ncbi:hypothetical protein WAI453_009570 [Rhynchosporium graminicola]|uniref:Endo-1,4-beta-xylanase n=1 Tax=Rhynchosporium graminicola TaxID=2792576 RepID=A0A1E1KT31_9HELO|nr:related to endo-1,4-beta-xylanase B precursor [Rhynchosporium commune]
MVSLGSILGALFLSACSLATPATAAETQNETHVETRPVNAVQYWVNGAGKVDFVNGPGGQWSAKWDNPPGGDFVVGKGYRPATDMLFNYSGTFDGENGNAYLGVYGWSIDPLAEYYIIESFGNHNPSDNIYAIGPLGTFQSDDGTYEIWRKPRYGDSIVGIASFTQYFSIRTTKRVGGTINTGNHFRAWDAVGLKLGTKDSFLMVVEGQQGTGSANITVGLPPKHPVPETPTDKRRTAFPGPTSTATTTSQHSTMTTTSRPEPTK